MQSRRIVSADRAVFELWQQHSGGESSKGIDKKILRRVISERLTPIQREYLSDYYFDEMTMRDIAKKHGVTIPTVSRTIKRAKHRISESLKYLI